MTSRGWIVLFVVSATAMLVPGLAWSDWFLLAGGLGSLAAAAYLATEPTKS